MSSLVRWPSPRPTQDAGVGPSQIIPAAAPLQQVIGLRLWLAARRETGYANGAAVATPINWSGHGNTYTQATGTKQPTYQTGLLDGQPGFRFAVATAREWVATTGDILAATNAASGLTVFVVAQRTGSVGVTEQFLDFRTNTTTSRFKYGYRFVAAQADRWHASGRRLDADAQTNATSGVTVDTNWHLHTVAADWSAGTIDFYREQTLDAGGVAWTSAGTTSATNSLQAAVGSQGGSEYVTGDIAELLVYDRVLSAADRQAVWDYLLGIYPSLAAGVSGAAQGQQRTAGTTDVRKQAAGAAQSANRVSGVTVAAKTVAGASSGQQRSSGVAAGRKQATQAVQGQQRTAGTASVRKQALGTVSGQQRSSGAASVRKQAAGAAIGAQRSSGLAERGAGVPTGAAQGQQRTSGVTAGSKQVPGAATGHQRSAANTAYDYFDSYGQVFSSGGIKGGIGAAQGHQRTAGQAATGPARPAVGQQRSSGTAAGRKTGITSILGQQRSRGITTGIHRGTTTAAGQQRTSTVGVGVKGGRGPALGHQRTAGSVEGAVPPPVPPPRWVEGATASSNQIEGVASGSGQVEGILVGAGIVEGSSGV